MPVKDHKQRIEYIRTIASLARTFSKPGDLSLAVDNIQQDIGLILEESLKEDAERIWRILAAIDRSYSAGSSQALEELAALLESRDR